MDQIKALMAHLFRFRFWYICGLSLVAVLVNWFLIFGSLQTAQGAGAERIKSKADEIDRVLKTSVPVGGQENQTVSVHPNESTRQGMAAEIAAATDKLIRAWELRRKAQEAILVWPTEVIGSEQFVKKFSEFDPPEKFENISATPEINGFCQLYYQRIQQRMPKIAEIIGATWRYKIQKPATPPPATGGQGDGGDSAQAGGGTGGGDAGESGQGLQAGGGDERPDGQGGGGEQPPAETTPPAGETPPPKAEDVIVPVKPETVIWSEKSQLLWLDKMVRFLGRDGARMEYPTGYQVLALQQDLWLLESMFKAIATVNGDAIANDLVPIKTIYYVVFGREARSQLGKVMVPSAKLAGSQTAALPAGAAGTPEPDPLTGAAAGAAPGAFRPEVPPKFRLLSPFHGRYVDMNFQPISIERMYNALTGTAAAGTDLEMIVAKRVPFRIAFRMSERSIPDFIAACSNSPFEFEVAQVRINRFDREVEFKPGDGASSGSSGFASASDGNSLASTAIKGKDAPEKRTRDDVDVEFYGVVRIYNPVDPARAKAVAGETAAPGT